jgi:hypothetical protein
MMMVKQVILLASSSAKEIQEYINEVLTKFHADDVVDIDFRVDKGFYHIMITLLCEE